MQIVNAITDRTWTSVADGGENRNTVVEPVATWPSQLITSILRTPTDDMAGRICTRITVPADWLRFSPTRKTLFHFRQVLNFVAPPGWTLEN
jgi:hypothetical protein